VPKSSKRFNKKFFKKNFIKNNIPSPDFEIFDGTSDEIKIDFPFVQKLNTGGYDGKGVQIIKNAEDLKNLWVQDSVLENLVDIDKELSIIIAKNENGETKTFPVTEMVADEKLNLLDFNICPADISSEVQSQIDVIAEKFIKSANSAGLLPLNYSSIKTEKFG
jgi:5-(carboxyamino)imidazole ribonucleotide synthase